MCIHMCVWMHLCMGWIKYISSIVKNQSLRGRFLYPWNKNPLSRDLNTSFNHITAAVCDVNWNVGKRWSSMPYVYSTIIKYFSNIATINLNEGKYKLVVYHVSHVLLFLMWMKPCIYVSLSLSNYVSKG